MYGAAFPMLALSFFECIGFAWVYGYKNMSLNIKAMIGSEPWPFWKITWMLVVPAAVVVIFSVQFYNWGDHYIDGVLPLSTWAEFLGIFLMCVSVIQVPIWFIGTLIFYATIGQGPLMALKPNKDWKFSE